MKSCLSILASLVLSTPLGIATDALAAKAIPQNINRRLLWQDDIVSMPKTIGYHTAIAMREGTIAIDSDDATFYYQRGNEHAKQGKPELAFIDYNRAIQLFNLQKAKQLFKAEGKTVDVQKADGLLQQLQQSRL